MQDANRPILSRIWLYSVLPALVIWMVLELLAGMIAWLSSDTWREGWRSFYQPHTYRSYEHAPGRISGPGHMSTNAFGLRGREISRVRPPATVRIACIGASTTYSDGATTDSHTYPAQVETLLREHYANEDFDVEVLNAGINAYDSLQVLMYLETELLDFAPDVVLILTGINDAVLMAQSVAFESDYTSVRRSFAPPRPVWWEHSPLVSLVFKRWATAGNPYWPNEEKGMLPFIWKRGAIDMPTTETAARRFRSARSDPHARNLRSLVSVIRGNGAVPVLLTLPFNFDQQPVAPFVARVNERIRAFAAAEKIALLDLAKKLPWSTDAFYDGCHLIDGPEGLSRKARIVVDFLVESDLVTDAAQRMRLPTDQARENRHE